MVYVRHTVLIAECWLSTAFSTKKSMYIKFG